MKRRLLLLGVMGVLAACATVPYTNRKQFNLISSIIGTLSHFIPNTHTYLCIVYVFRDEDLFRYACAFFYREKRTE